MRDAEAPVFDRCADIHHHDGCDVFPKRLESGPAACDRRCRFLGPGIDIFRMGFSRQGQSAGLEAGDAKDAVMAMAQGAKGRNPI